MTVDRLRSLLPALLLIAPVALADEGMWTFDNPPARQLKEKYGFEPTREWLEHLRLASVRFMDGGSGSFVSPDGLMITNHHVGLGCIQNVSSAEKDYVRAGFYAETRQKEAPCPGYEVNVLTAMEDVTARVQAAVKPQMTDAQAREARKAQIATIANQCSARTKLRCDVVTLYQGGEYQLYQYRKYTDVRLVFAPEQQVAFYGGDPDNFTFPRHDVDICIMRAYENGQPAKPAAFLRWSGKGTAAGDLVFVSGNPGSTSRLETMARLDYLRDQAYPFRLMQFKRRLEALRAYAARGPEQQRRALELIFGYENSQKAIGGYLAALKDAAAMAGKAEAEKALRARVSADPALAQATGDPWTTVAAVQQKLLPRAPESRLVNFGGSRLLGIAGTIVEYVAEVSKPNEKRYEEYVDANLDSLRNALFSPAPVYTDLDEVTLADEFQLAQETLGAEHPFVEALLQGRTPAEAARAAIAGTKLGDPAVRQALVSGGEGAVAASTDAMIVLARRVDPMVREARRFLEDEVEAPTTRAMEKIAQARWKVYGRTVPPDATFTLRLAYGTVKPYPAEGTVVAPFTTYYGLLDRAISHGNQAPWQLVPRWQERKGALDLATPLDFVSTADIIGGNSGSPVVDRAGEFVGIIFDGNIESLAWDFYFDDERGRAVAVDARGIVEALRTVYQSDGLVGELTGR
ncbi:MAG TPA: S46 family peptidase [Vicinamibacteria bacterium]|nr:S46 family peptidase [Vicinamibacteria bacterium]